LEDGDKIVIDPANESLEMLVDEDEMKIRKAAHKPNSPNNPARGVQEKFRRLVNTADKGATTS